MRSFPLREFKSGELYAQVLKEEGFEVEHPFCGIETAFRASYGSGKPVIGILAEYDALTGLSQVAGQQSREELVSNGNGHGCGHNLLGAGSMAAAFAISTIWRKRERGAEGDPLWLSRRRGSCHQGLHGQGRRI